MLHCCVSIIQHLHTTVYTIIQQVLLTYDYVHTHLIQHLHTTVYTHIQHLHTTMHTLIQQILHPHLLQYLLVGH